MFAGVSCGLSGVCPFDGAMSKGLGWNNFHVWHFADRRFKSIFPFERLVEDTKSFFFFFSVWFCLIEDFQRDWERKRDIEIRAQR